MAPAMVSLGLSCLVIALVIWSNTFPYTPGDWNVGGAISFVAGSIAGGFLVFCATLPVKV